MTFRIQSALSSSRIQCRWLLAVYVIAIAVITVQRGIFDFPNDYAIFRWSFYNLIDGRDLYILHSGQAFDLFKYSPTFAVLFAPFALLPFVLGLFAWNLLNALALFAALKRVLPWTEARVAIGLVFLPILRSAQSAQSNALVAACVIFAFFAFERRTPVTAAASIVLGAAVKVFPLAALSLAAFNADTRHRLRFVVIFGAIAIIALALPLAFIEPQALVAQYRSWLALESNQRGWYGMSAMGVLHEWAGWPWPAWPLQIAGTLLLLLPLAVRGKGPSDREFRLRYLASLLLYMVIFNHKAERQSAVIALAGLAIWFVTSPRTVLRIALTGLVLLLTSLFATLPLAVRQGFSPLVLEAFPITLVWIVMQAELLGLSSRDRAVAPGRDRAMITPGAAVVPAAAAPRRIDRHRHIA